MTPITTTNNLLRRLYQDDRNEGDLNEFSFQTVAAACAATQFGPARHP